MYKIEKEILKKEVNDNYCKITMILIKIRLITMNKEN